MNYADLWIQDISRRLGYAMDSAIVGKDLIKELHERLPKMKKAEVDRVIKKYLGIDKLAIAIVTDKGAEVRQQAGRRRADADHLRHRGHAARDPGRGQGHREVPAAGQGRQRQGGAGRSAVREGVGQDGDDDRGREIALRRRAQGAGPAGARRCCRPRRRRSAGRPRPAPAPRPRRRPRPRRPRARAGPAMRARSPPRPR